MHMWSSTMSDTKAENARKAKHSSLNPNWQTPSNYVESARKVMGKIDLDPASTPKANKAVKAAKIYTKNDDGLKKKWFGCVFLNPPGGIAPPGGVSRSSSVVWLWKLRRQIDKGNVKEAIFIGFSLEILQNGQLGQSLANVPFCIPRQRIRFIHPKTGEPAKQPGHANAILYFGKRPQVFAGEFAKYGDVHNVRNR